MSARSIYEVDAIRDARKLRRSLARKEEIEAGHGSGAYAALLGKLMEQIDGWLAEIDPGAEESAP